MTRAELLALLTAASGPWPEAEFLVVGSQSVLGAYDDSELPER